MRLILGKIGWGVVGILLLITPLWASSPRAEAGSEQVTAYNWAYAEEASKLLREIRGLSTRLAEDSDYLEHHARRNQLDWRSHAAQLNQIRGDINAMGKHLQRLQEIHSMIAPVAAEGGGSHHAKGGRVGGPHRGSHCPSESQ